MRYQHVFHLIQIKSPGLLHADDALSSGPARARLPPQGSPMQKFALKMLLTGLTVGRSSSRQIRGMQFVTADLIPFLLATVGLYVWAHGGN
jgi:hypothetical protein